MPELLVCSTCGNGVLDTPEGNVSHGEVPSPHDTGYGLCRSCGGDPNGADELIAAGADEERATRRRIGWAMAMFVDARIPLLAEKLRPDLRAKLEAMTYARKVDVICRMVERGYMT